MHAKHISRWFLIFAGLIVLYYIYREVMAAFTATVSAATAPITGAEKLGNSIVTGVTSGISTLYDDIKSVASAIVGESTDSVSSTPPASNLGVAQLIQGQTVTPSTILMDNGIQVGPNGGGAYLDPATGLFVVP